MVYIPRHYYCLNKKITIIVQKNKKISKKKQTRSEGETVIVNNNDGSLWPSILEIGQVKKIYKIESNDYLKIIESVFFLVSKIIESFAGSNVLVQEYTKCNRLLFGFHAQMVNPLEQY